MNILLINPILKGDFTSLHNALISIATYIDRETSHKVQIADLSFQRTQWRKYLQETVDHFEPDVVGITSTYIFYDCALQVANFIKTVSKALVILGGQHATMSPEEIIKERSVDAVCLNDGEEVVKDLLDGMEGNGDIYSVSGLWIKKDGDVIKNVQRPLERNLNKYSPWNWDLYNDLDKQLYFFRHIPLQGCRGCGYGCTFCSAKLLRERSAGPAYRYIDPQLLAEEARLQYDKYKEHHLEFFRFCDPVFTQDSEWVEQFVFHYKEAGLKGFPFSVLARVDHLDAKRLKLLKEAGCIELRLGLESGDDYIRNDIFKKGITTKLISETIPLIKKYKISIVGYFMLGAPGETKETLRSTFSFIQKIDIDTPAVFSYKPIPKTEAFKTLGRLGGRVESKKSKKLISLFKGEVVHTPYLTPRDIGYYKTLMSIYVLFRKTRKEIKGRGMKFFTEYPGYLFRGFQNKMDFESITVSFINRKRRLD